MSTQYGVYWIDGGGEACASSHVSAISAHAYAIELSEAGEAIDGKICIQKIVDDKVV